MLNGQGIVLVTCLTLIGSLAVTATAEQTVIPSFPEGCPYIDTSCTRVELRPIRRNDTCHQEIASGFSQDVAVADEQQVHQHNLKVF